MVTIFLVLIKIIIASILGVTAIVFLVLTVLRFKQQKAKWVFLPLFMLFAVLAYLVFDYDTSSSETANRQDAEPAFVSNFKFTPPPSVKEIKVKNHVIADAVVHWMGFTYDSLVLNRIVSEDTALLVAEQRSTEFEEAVLVIKEKNPNTPEWLHFTKETTRKIYYKKNFMNHTFSEFYLWVNKEDKMVYLYVSFFD